MIIQPKYTLRPDDRLKSRKTIGHLFAKGQSFGVFPLRVIYLEAGKDRPHLQAGFSVSSRHFKKAVDRNRIKRLLRESYRLQKHALQQKLEEGNKHLAVFILYTGKELPEYYLIQEKMRIALEILLAKA